MQYEIEYSKTHLHFPSEIPQWIPFRGGKSEFGRILDLGTGGRDNAIALRNRYPGAHVVATGLSLIRCQACKQVAPVDVACADALVLPFAGQSFDLVVSTQVIEHVPDDFQFVSEAKRVLKPNSIALISSVLKLSRGRYLYHNARGEWVLDPTHLREYGGAGAYENVFARDLRLLRTEVDRFKFAPFQFAHRAITKFGLVDRPNPNVFNEAKGGRLVGRLRVLTPHCRHITAIAQRAA